MRIYIAGPYTVPTEAGRLAYTLRAMDAAISVGSLGHHPFIPHLWHFFEARANARGTSFSYETYMEWGFGFLAACDALLYLGSSPGADRELARARELGLRIFLSVDEIRLAGLAEAS